jgi:hypothetical protein
MSMAAACGGGGDAEEIERAGAPVVEDAAPIERGEVVAGYEITYAIEEIVDGEAHETEATLTVQRPFRSRFEAGDLLRIADFGYFAEKEPGDETEVVTAVPTPAPGDIRVDVLDLGPPVEARAVLDRVCEVHRFGASLLTGIHVEGDTVEACIDADGIVLEEVTTIGGEIVERRLATRVEVDPTVPDSSFVLEGFEPRSADDGGGSLQAVVPTSRPPGLFFQLDVAPEGFERKGRYAMVPPQRARLDDEHTRPQYIAGMVEVWTRGLDVVVIEQGGTLGRIPPFGADPNGELVDDLGDVAALGELLLTPYGAEVRGLIPPGRYLKVRGTLPVDDLLAITRALVRVEGDGTGLVYID